MQAEVTELLAAINSEEQEVQALRLQVRLPPKLFVTCYTLPHALAAAVMPIVFVIGRACDFATDHPIIFLWDD